MENYSVCPDKYFKESLTTKIKLYLETEHNQTTLVSIPQLFKQKDIVFENNLPNNKSLGLFFAPQMHPLFLLLGGSFN